MGNRIFTIAYYTFLEMVRNKIMYLLIFFALFILGLGVAITQMTIGDELSIIADIGLGTIEIFSTILAIFMGVSTVHKELALKTLHPLLARPVSRAEYILGKFFGMQLTVLVLSFFMCTILFVMMMLYGGTGKFFTVLPAAYTIFVQTSMVISVATLCSTLAEPAVAAMLTISYYIVGATSYNLIYLVTRRSSEFTKSAVTTLRFILPDFHYLNIKDNLVYSEGLKNISITAATLYSLASIIIILSLAIILFNKKEIH